jgi:hypothetical protein
MFSIFSLENIISFDTLAWINTLCVGLKKLALCGKGAVHMYEREADGNLNLYSFALKTVPFSFLCYTFMRLSIGMMTLATSIIIVCQADSASGVFQDFAGLGAIAGLDNLVFTACQMRFITKTAFEVAAKVSSQTLHAENLPYTNTILKAFVVVCLIVPFFTTLSLVTRAQISGAHCPEISVSTGDEGYAGLSGLYRWDGTYSNDRAVYRQVHAAGNKFAKKYVIVHCSVSTSWTFLEDQSTAGQASVFFEENCGISWLIMSEVDRRYTIFSPAKWFAFSRSLGIFVVPQMHIKCNVCESSNQDLQCNRGGTCSDDGRCECRAGGFGPTCDFAAPCRTVNIDFSQLPSNGSLIAKQVQGFYTYARLSRCEGKKAAECVDVSPTIAVDTYTNGRLLDTVVDWYKKQDRLLTSSMRPVYINWNVGRIMFHDGARWALTTMTLLGIPPPQNASQVQAFFESFHSYSNKSEMSKVTLFSDVTPVVSPDLAKAWYTYHARSNGESNAVELPFWITCTEVDPDTTTFKEQDTQIQAGKLSPNGGTKNPSNVQDSTPPPPPPNVQGSKTSTPPPNAQASQPASPPSNVQGSQPASPAPNAPPPSAGAGGAV